MASNKKIPNSVFRKNEFYLISIHEEKFFYENKDMFHLIYNQDKGTAEIRDRVANNFIFKNGHSEFDLRTESDLLKILSLCVLNKKRDITKKFLLEQGFYYDYQITRPIRILSFVKEINPSGRYLLKEGYVEEYFFHPNHGECVYDSQSNDFKVYSPKHGILCLKRKEDVIKFINE